MTGGATYLLDAQVELVQFEVPITKDELLAFIRQSQREGKAEQRAHPGRRALPQPTDGVDWDGEELKLSPVGAGSRLFRFCGKRPEAAPRPVDLRADAGVGGAAGAVTPRGDVLEAGDGHVWLVAGGSVLELGHEVGLAGRPKSVAIGNIGLFEDISKSTVIVERVKIVDVANS